MNIGSLWISLGADTAGLTSAEKRAEQFGFNVGRALKRAAQAATAATTLAVGFAVALTKSSMEAIDAQAKLAKRVGGTVAALQGLEHAADLAGLSKEALTKSLEKLNQRLGEVVNEGAGEAYDALQRLGLSAKALSEMDVDERIKTLAGRMQELGYTTQQQADVLRSFGIRNMEMINLMQEGSAAIDQARRDVEAWGVALSDVDAAKVEAANDALSRIKTVFTGIGNQLAVKLSPIIEAIATAFTDAARETGGFADAIERAIKRALASVGGLLDSLHQVRFLLLAIETGAARIDLGAAKLLPWRSGEVEGLQKEFDGLARSLHDMANSKLPSEEIDAWMMKAEAAAAMRERFDVAFGNDRTGAGGDDTESDADRDLATKQQEELATRLATLRESLLTEREAELNSYATRMADLEEFYRKGLITQEEYNELALAAQRDHADGIKRLDEDVARSAHKAARARGQAIDSILSDVSSTINSLFGESKAAAIASAIINTAQAVTKTLAQYGGTPWGFAAAAAAAAAGVAQIAAMRRTNSSGGGSVPSVGNAGGAQEPSAGAGQTLFINGLTTGSLFSGESVRELAEKLIDFQRDGGKVVLGPA